MSHPEPNGGGRREDCGQNETACCFHGRTSLGARLSVWSRKGSLACASVRECTPSVRVASGDRDAKDQLREVGIEPNVVASVPARPIGQEIDQHPGGLAL